MRLVLDPVPLVLGIYAYVSGVLTHALDKVEDGGAEALGRRLSRQRTETTDRDVQKIVRALHSDVKVADKLLKKTGDVWKISQETDLVDIVITPRGDEAQARAYVLLRPQEIRALLGSIRAAAQGTGEDAETLERLESAAAELEGRPSDYLAFGFDPWKGS